MPVHSAAIHSVLIAQVKIGSRQRKDMGDLESLAASMAVEGLLQPIGVTEDYELVFGQRRLLAARDVLRWDRIEARIVRVSSILAGEYTENEIRKDFTASERVAIGKAIETALGNRQGQRTDKGLPQNIGEVEPGTETIEAAAQKAGFGNPETYRQAKKVTETAAPELVQAMDSGALSISAASVIAQEPQEEQARIARLPKPEQRQAVRKVRERSKLPTPSQARKQAKKLGVAVADNQGYYQTGASPAEQKRATVELSVAMNLVRAIEALAETKQNPDEFARDLKPMYGRGLPAQALIALAWLKDFCKGLHKHGKVPEAKAV